MAKYNLVFDSQLLSSLMSCYRLANYRFNDNLVRQGGKSNSLECGSIVHSFMEAFYKAQRAGLSKDKAIEAGMNYAKLYIHGCPDCKLETCTNHKDNEFIGVQNTPEQTEKVGKSERLGWVQVLRTILEYLDFYKNDFWIPLEVEHVKGALLYEDDVMSIIWKAKFDLIVDTNQQILPVDHKTSKQRRDTLSLNNQFMGQCFLTGSRNVVINKIGFQTSLPHNQKFERVMMSYSKDRLLEWQTEIVPFYARMLIQATERNYWPPNFTHCENKYGFCDMKEVCESDRNMRPEVIKMNFLRGKAWDIQND